MMKKIDDLIKEYGLNQKQAEVVASDLKELIVPAGAGSGKTKTLVTKVLELLKSGKNLDNFLVLTFTKKAASEMKERIKKELINANLIEMANKIDSANISTFDAFAYNFVKQNANLIGLDSNIELLDQSFFNNIKHEIIESILLDIMTNNKDSELYEFLQVFSGKTDENELVSALLNVYNNLTEIAPLSELIPSELIINTHIFNYDKFYDDLSFFSEEFISENYEYMDNVKSYFMYLNSEQESFNEFDVPRFKWKDLNLSKEVRKEIDKILKPVNELIKAMPKLVDLREYFNEEIKYVTNIINLLIRYETKLIEFKQNTNKYEFNDIANFLNKILREHERILLRQKEKFKFVFVDEYQDTSKVQSEFLEMLILNNEDIRVLYVGDIKQSIYKFRNARPDTFLKKQKEVSVISLDTNYRSSNKVIDFVNKSFKNILNDEVKYDINYKQGHVMESGNKKYNEDKSADVFLIEMYKDDESRTRNDAVEEAFVIGNKINELLESNKIDKYSDVAILARNKSNFKIYSDVFNYLNIPIQIQVDQELKQTYLLKLAANILKLASIIDVNDKYLMNDKRFLYFSILRSELFEYNDFKIFESLLDINDPKVKTLKIDNDIYNKLRELNKIIKTKSNFEIIDHLIKSFDVYQKISITKKAQEKNYQIEYLYKTATTLSDLSINSLSFVDYIYNLAYDDEIKLTVSVLEDKDENSVKVTNIHQSKGLEYNTLFVAGLNKGFNKGIIKAFNFTNIGLFNFNFKNINKSSQFIALNDYIKSFRTSLVLEDNLKEELRLLYVALTRAEKALYLVTTPKDDYIELNSFTDYLYYNDFTNYIKNENIYKHSDYLKTSDYYLYLKANNKYYDERIDFLEERDFKLELKEMKTLKASSDLIELIDNNTFNNINSGTKLHLDFEYQNLDNSLVNKLLNTKFNNKSLSNAEIITEYEFTYEKDNESITGVIDLLAIHEDEVHIIDYKLRDLSNDNYLKQLNTYKDYISKVFDKEIKMYLYSISTGEVKEVMGH